MILKNALSLSLHTLSVFESIIISETATLNASRAIAPLEQLSPESHMTQYGIGVEAHA